MTLLSGELISCNHMAIQFNKKQAIQFCYLEIKPNWEVLPEYLLIELILDYENEQSCATSALYEMSSRNHEKAVELAK